MSNNSISGLTQNCSSSPKHSVQDEQCREYVFEICQLIAQSSDPGRNALIQNGAINVLLLMANDNRAFNVLNGFKILIAIAHTGTYRDELISAGVKNVAKRITRYVIV